MDLHLDYEELKQIFTPYHVCQLMADITMDDLVEQIDKQGYVSINDCCCGAGANLIAAINSARRKLEDAGLNFQNHILIIGQDIEELVALMCYIQISLLGVAAVSYTHLDVYKRQLEDLTALVNHNFQAFEKRVAKLSRKSSMLTVLAVAAVVGVYALAAENRKREEQVYQLSVRVKKLEYDKGE